MLIGSYGLSPFQERLSQKKPELVAMRLNGQAIVVQSDGKIHEVYFPLIFATCLLVNIVTFYAFFKCWQEMHMLCTDISYSSIVLQLSLSLMLYNQKNSPMLLT